MTTPDTPLVSFVVPCYNSAGYMRRAVDSIVGLGQACEILLINDGSSDDTSKIAHKYAERHSNVRAIDQENANWGGAVNHGLELARGRYFKVLDSDDYMEPLALRRVLSELEQALAEDDAPDLLISNYVYDHLPTKTRRPMRYSSFLPQGHTFGWNEVQKPGVAQYLMIHACWYATEVLRASGVKLPTGVPYMDSILLLHPMPTVKRLRYVDAAPYYYAIGREGQSVDASVIAAHIDQQLYATRLAIEDVDYAELFRREPNCGRLMAGYMECMMSMSELNLFLIGTPEAAAKNKELWAFLEEKNPALYDWVRRSWVGLLNRKTPMGRAIAARIFQWGKKHFKLE